MLLFLYWLDKDRSVSLDLTCCLWQIYGLKTLVKSFLPRRGQVVRKIDDLLNILKKTLKSQGYAGIKSWYVPLIVIQIYELVHFHYQFSLGTFLILVDLSYDRIETCSEDTGAHVRLAAAKAILLLSRKWDLHISPETFRLTILMGKVK